MILEKKLYVEPAFRGHFAGKFPNFDPDKPTPAEQQYLLKRFQDRLKVQTVPRTLVLPYSLSQQERGALGSRGQRPDQRL